MDKKKISIVVATTLAATYIVYSNTCYVSETSILGFLNASPMLIGIILASVLTSLAIILAIIGENEMIKIRELEKARNKDFYKIITKNLKHDIYFILASFILSSFLTIFCINNAYFTIPINNLGPIAIYKFIFLIDSILLIFSVMAAYDITNGLFYIFEFKYELANKYLDKD